MNLDNWYLCTDFWENADGVWHCIFYVAYHVRGFEPAFFEFDQQTLGMDGVDE